VHTQCKWSCSHVGEEIVSWCSVLIASAAADAAVDAAADAVADAVADG